MPDLNGKHAGKVDTKGRLTVPSSFRKKLSNNLVATVNPKDECFYVFEDRDFNAWVQSYFEKLGGFDPFNDKHTQLRRGLKEKAISVDIDSSGRINLPAESRKLVGIDKDVVFIGNVGYFEIWDAKRWEDSKVDIDTLMAQLSLT